MKKAFGIIYILVGALIFFATTVNCIVTLPDLMGMEDAGGFMAMIILIFMALYAFSVFLIWKGVKRFKVERKDFKDQLDEF